MKKNTEKLILKFEKYILKVWNLNLNQVQVFYSIFSDFARRIWNAIFDQMLI